MYWCEVDRQRALGTDLICGSVPSIFKCNPHNRIIFEKTLAIVTQRCYYIVLYFHIRYGLDAAYWIVIISFYCLSRKFMLYFTVFIVLYGRNFCG